MKILIVGSGGREHALAWKLAQSPHISGMIASPGNPGIARVATCVPAPRDVSGYADIAQAHGVDLTIVGPEAPLVAGIVDQFYDRSLKIIGPTQAAARLEGSKIFAKQFFGRAGILTARSFQVTSYDEAVHQLGSFDFPLVVKADGLAGGKGVTIAQNREEALIAIKQLGPNLVLEEFLVGEEVSFIGLSNGYSLLPFAPTQDHKRLLDHDEGPNTGGMGAYSDMRILTSAESSQIMERIMLPAITRMQREGTPFTGFLYAGLMMTSNGPKVLEFNVRLGDPETQVLMHSFKGDFLEVLDMLVHGAETIPEQPWSSPSVCVVLAAQGYPEQPLSGQRITGIEAAEMGGATVFLAGTKIQNGSLVTAGGRVLGVTASGETLNSAIDSTYAAVKHIRFEGMHYRNDIGQKGLGRW
ncbi:MAG: phosphoribosylamine--glycine ligase [Acidobacteriaceae bacterium]|nr:phosphoribosylamine--glycine ligase [Acidobacteriaceae bacterium]